MKKFFLLGLIAPFLLSFQGEIEDMCNEKEAKNKALTQLLDYSYSSSKTSNFIFINNEQVREIELNLFEGEDYRLVFNNEYLPENVEVRVYDKPKEDNRRKMLLTSKEEPSQAMFVYEPSWRHRNIYIDYIVPPSSTDKIMRGCAVFVLGYKLNFIN